MTKFMNEGALRGFGYWFPKEDTPGLSGIKLLSLLECKHWLKNHNHGWSDKKHHVGRRGRRYARRIVIYLYFNGIGFDSKPLTLKKFREVVSELKIRLDFMVWAAHFGGYGGCGCRSRAKRFLGVE